MNDSINLKNFKQSALPEIEKTLINVVERNVNATIGDLRQIYLYHLGLDESKNYQAKRIRPLLVLLTAYATGTDWQKALPLAAAVELLHNFSLIHDDIEDHDLLRRSRPTVWAKWGTSQAINAGDGMFALVFKVVTGLEDHCSEEFVLTALNAISNTCLKLIEGQFLDVAFEGCDDISLEKYWEIIGGKTAALIGCSIKLGGLVSNLKYSELDELYQFGYKLGLNYQIQDDLLGIWGDAGKVGKSIISDLVNRKVTLPVIYGLQMSPRFRVIWQKGKVDSKGVSEIAQWLKDDGVYSEVKKILDENNEFINKFLETSFFVDLRGQELLFELISQIRTREK